MTDVKHCIVCGTEFVPNSPSQKICGKKECLRARRKEYAQTHADMYKALQKKHRSKARVKKYRAEYDKQYQVEHKDQIKEYKKLWWQKKRFLNYLDKGVLLKNMYYYTLTDLEKQQALDKINK